MDVRVTPVSSSRDLRAFIELPFRLYKGDPNWVPPLRSDVKWILDEEQNPFWKHAKRLLLLARYDSRVVGRIAVIVDSEHNKVHQDKTGFFGFFECENDMDFSQALFAAAEKAVKELLPGCDRLRGPVNPSMNEEVGALVPAESEPGPPLLMMTYNPAYYLELFELSGLEKEKDLLAILAPVSDHGFARLSKLAERALKREPGLSVRIIKMDKFEEELAVVKEIYNKAWEKNWGFVPMTSEEIDAMAKKLKPLIYPPYIWFAYMNDKPAAFMLGMPDYNEVLIKMGGSLFPFGWLTFLLQQKKIDRCRLMAFGVVPEFRKKGIDAILYYYSMNEGIKKGITTVEFSWMLEDNQDILKPLEVFGGRIYRRYRIVSKAIQ